MLIDQAETQEELPLQITSSIESVDPGLKDELSRGYTVAFDKKTGAKLVQTDTTLVACYGSA
jgi:hypothetical protein